MIEEIVRGGARRMLAEPLRAEGDVYIAQYVEERDERGRRLVVRNSSDQGRQVLTSAGAVERPDGQPVAADAAQKIVIHRS